jgi:hypothetical protein
MREIVFFSTVNGVADAFPINYSKNFKFDWVEAVRKDYKEELDKNKHTRFNHAYRCPGIFDLMGQGFIIPMPWDVSIETRGDGKDFAWSFPSGDLQEIFDSPLITGHRSDAIAKNLPINPGSLSTIIKLNTPWHIIAPADVKFLMISIPYPDTFEFESAMGILDPGISSEINFQLKWNILDGIYTIRAGTPMVQLIPLTDEKFKLTVRNGTAKDLEWVKKRKYLNNCTIMLKRPMIQNLYKKYFSKETILSKILRFLPR